MEWPEDAEIRKPVWGPWATAGFSLVVGAAYWVTVVFTLLFIVVAIVVVRNSPEAAPDMRDLEELRERVMQSGLFQAMATCGTTIVCSGLILLIIRLRKNVTATDYLALYPVRIKTLLFLAVVVLGWIVAWDNVNLMLGKRVVPQFMLDAYRTAGWAPLLWVAMVVMAPLSEELFFRGFLFAGLRQSWFSDLGAILLTSLAWASSHLQNDDFDRAQMFLFGFLLGVVRVRTGSLWSCIAMHALLNLAATLQAELCLRGIWIS